MEWEEYKKLCIKWNEEHKRFECIVCGLHPIKCKCGQDDR